MNNKIDISMKFLLRLNCWTLFALAFEQQFVNISMDIDVRIKALSDAIKQLFIKNLIEFDVIIYGNASKSTID